MKLLDVPKCEIETIELGKPVEEYHTRLRFFGLLGLGPLLETRKVVQGTGPVLTFAGRRTFNQVRIDFEAIILPSKLKKPVTLTLDVEGKQRTYTFHGLLPIQLIDTKGTVWLCVYDHFTTTTE